MVTQFSLSAFSWSSTQSSEFACTYGLVLQTTDHFHNNLISPKIQLAKVRFSVSRAVRGQREESQKKKKERNSAGNWEVCLEYFKEKQTPKLVKCLSLT